MRAVRVAMVCVVALLAPRWAAAQAGGDPPAAGGEKPDDGAAKQGDKKDGDQKKKRGKKHRGKKHRRGKKSAAGKDAASKDAAAGKDAAGKDAAGKDDAGADPASKEDDTELPPGVEATPPSTGGPGGAPTGTEENPHAPVTDFDRPVEVEATVAAPVVAVYPIERALRPITLPRRMTEVTLDAPNSFNPYVQSGLLGIHHGITREIQVGLRYGTGTLFDGEYFTGKTVAIDGEYQIFHWLSAQLAVPMMFDPYSVGVTVGAPMKFTVLDRLRFDIFRDLVTFKVSRFAPSVVDAAGNDAQVVADETNSVLEDGEINANAAASWQLQPNMSIEGRFGVKARDFEFQSDSPTMFDLGLIYSSTNKVDIGGRFGFADLNHTDNTFGLWLLAAIRI